MSEDTPSGVGEVDALKWYIVGMTIVSVLGAGVVWWLRDRTTQMRADVESARRSLPELAMGKGEIKAMLAAYKRNKEDEARDQPLTWFQARWKAKGIDDSQVELGKWKDPPDTGRDGSYDEEKIGLKFPQKNPLRREQIAQLLHEIEQNSTRLRVISLRVQRNGREEGTIENDEWNGNCEVGYRYPRLRD